MATEIESLRKEVEQLKLEKFALMKELQKERDDKYRIYLELKELRS